MNIDEKMRAALLDYLQREVDQLAESITSWQQRVNVVQGEDGADGYWVAAYSVVTVCIRYTVDRQVARCGWREWTFGGDLPELIWMLDNEELMNR